jgi:hypothetical protein
MVLKISKRISILTLVSILCSGQVFAQTQSAKAPITKQFQFSHTKLFDEERVEGALSCPLVLTGSSAEYIAGQETCYDTSRNRTIVATHPILVNVNSGTKFDLTAALGEGAIGDVNTNGTVLFFPSDSSGTPTRNATLYSPSTGQMRTITLNGREYIYDASVTDNNSAFIEIRGGQQHTFRIYDLAGGSRTIAPFLPSDLAAQGYVPASMTGSPSADGRTAFASISYILWGRPDNIVRWYRVSLETGSFVQLNTQTRLPGFWTTFGPAQIFNNRTILGSFFGPNGTEWGLFPESGAQARFPSGADLQEADISGSAIGRSGLSVKFLWQGQWIDVGSNLSPERAFTDIRVIAFEGTRMVVSAADTRTSRRAYYSVSFSDLS